MTLEIMTLTLNLSSNSEQDVESSKKQRERSFNESSILENVDVFTEGLIVLNALAFYINV